MTVTPGTASRNVAVISSTAARGEPSSMTTTWIGRYSWVPMELRAVQQPRLPREIWDHHTNARRLSVRGLRGLQPDGVTLERASDTG